MTRSYGRSAEFYDALHEFKDFPSQAVRIRRLIDEHRPGATSVLDVACGTGRHLALLGADFHRVGTDLSEEMLAIARRDSPRVDFRCQDMMELDVGQKFDVVMCLFSSIGYSKTQANLEKAISAMSGHLAPGGVLLIEPYFTPEQYWEGHLAVNHARIGDSSITWMYVQEKWDSVAHADIHYLAGRPSGVEHWVESHDVGLFTGDQYRSAFTSAGLEVEFRPVGVTGRGIYIGWA